MADMAAMAARYETLEEDEVIVPSGKGHTTASAAAAMVKWGKNEIPEEKEPLWKMFVMQFVGTMPAMIEIAGLLALSLGSYLDFWIIFALLMTNATLGFVEEMNAQASISALKDGLVRKLPVKRDGAFNPIDVSFLVPGDVVFLRGGNVVPADCVWLGEEPLEIDQAALTGESLPVEVPREDSDGEPGSGKKCWGGSIIKTGEAEVFVTETGLHTMIGEAAKAIQESGGKHVGVFEAKIIMAGRVLIILTIIAVSALLIYQVGFRGEKLEEILEMALSLTIASVPIALPMVMKVTLAVGAKEMAKEGGIVTHLTALEEIASMVVLCSDKTGTLTTAQMTVYHETAACFNGFSGKEVLELAALASNPANKDDAIDRSVYQAYAKMVGLGADVDTAATRLAAKWKTDKYFGFNPVIKRTVADVSQVGGGSTMRVAKGIVSKVLKTVEGDGGQQWVCDDYENTCKMVEEADVTFGKSGYKTIAIACSVNGGPMKYAGTLPIMDPPRADTAETIQKIKGAFIDVKMITGDHLNIAKELARQIDLGTNIFPNTVLWPASAMRDDLITKADGFAQVMPTDKHEVVAVLQKQGKVVGMTGDGVNDAPALAKAQIGIAVEGATDAAQAAADIVLTRPGLSPIYTAVMASRRIFKRLRSYVIYRISVTVQVVVFLSIISFAFNDKFDALYIILLALFHDLTIVTIAYDHQVASPKPETPTVKMLVVVAYSMAMVLATSSTLLYIYGDKFLSAAYATVFPYKESCLFLQISNSSAILIFNARTIGFSFLSKPHYLLFGSACVSQIFINLILLFGNGFIVEQLDPMDVAKIWIYDFSWLIIIDLVKISILKLQEGPTSGVDDTVGRNGMMRSSKSRSKSGTVTRRSGAPKLSKDLRVSLSGAPRNY
jgi:H+-transporting ATPase